MKTPFIFGKFASDDDFTDRNVERVHLKNNFRGLVNTVIVSPRRWGKSSLVNKVAEELAEEKDSPVIVRLDLFNCRTERQFFEKYGTAVIKATCSKLEEVAATVKKHLGRLMPILSIADSNSQFEFGFGLKIRDDEDSEDDILDLPQKIAEDKGIRIVVCIDEFQTINEYGDPLSFQRSLRAHWQRHGNVAYCLYGSKRNMLVEIFSKPKMPLYKFGDLILLEKIDAPELTDFIVRRFNDTGKTISTEQAGRIASLAENHPYYVQQLSQLVWFRTDGVCSDSDIDRAFSGLVNQLSLAFSMMTDELTPKQINFLRAICDGVKSFSSTETLTKYSFGTSANVKNIKTALQKKEIIDIRRTSVSVQDPIFAYWFKNIFNR